MDEADSSQIARSQGGAAGATRLPEIANERISKLFREAERIYALRPDLQGAFPDIRLWDFWFWFMWHGSLEYPEVERLLTPPPPDYLRQRVLGADVLPQAFHRHGLADWRRICSSLVEGSFDFDLGGRILDFGCGCGRLLRHFARYAHTCELVGADVDAEAIEWCRKSSDFATFETLPRHPPSGFPDNHFDAVYAFAVFSHLPEDLHRRWLEELRRITRPGAVVVLTVYGQRVIDKTLSGRSPSDVPSPETLQRDYQRIQESGFAFYPYRRLTPADLRNQRHFESWDLERYGETFILPSYFLSRWNEVFHVVSWNAAPDDWQDYVILRRRPDR